MRALLGELFSASSSRPLSRVAFNKSVDKKGFSKIISEGIAAAHPGRGVHAAAACEHL